MARDDIDRVIRTGQPGPPGQRPQALMPWRYPPPAILSLSFIPSSLRADEYGAALKTAAASPEVISAVRAVADYPTPALWNPRPGPGSNGSECLRFAKIAAKMWTCWTLPAAGTKPTPQLTGETRGALLIWPRPLRGCGHSVSVANRMGDPVLSRRPWPGLLSIVAMEGPWWPTRNCRASSSGRGHRPPLRGLQPGLPGGTFSTSPSDAWSTAWQAGN